MDKFTRQLLEQLEEFIDRVNKEELQIVSIDTYTTPTKTILNYYMMGEANYTQTLQTEFRVTFSEK